MVAAITGINFPSLASQYMPNEAVQQQLLKQSSDRAYFRDAVAVAISKDAAKMISVLKGETLPAVAIEFKQQLRNPGGKKQNPYQKSKKSAETDSDSETSSTTDSTASKKSEDSSEKETIRELKARDTEVRTHEQQHMAAAGAYARGGIVLDYQIGPDGKAYAIGGHVDMDTGPVQGNTQATIQKAQILKQAALAVSDPSSADKSIAVDAGSMEMAARAQLEDESMQTTKKTSAYKASALDAYNSATYRIIPGYMVNTTA